MESEARKLTRKSKFILQCWCHQAKSLSIHEIQKVAEATQEENVPLEARVRGTPDMLIDCMITWYFPMEALQSANHIECETPQLMTGGLQHDFFLLR